MAKVLLEPIGTPRERAVAEDAWRLQSAALEELNAALREKLHDVCEIYAGMDGFVPQTAPEDYQRRILKKMYDAAIAGKDKP